VSFVFPGNEMGHRTKLTYDMLPGSYLSGEEIQHATGDTLKKWLRCRGEPNTGNVADLRRMVQAIYEHECETHEVKLICPDARSLIEYLIQSKKVIDIPTHYDKDLFRGIRDSSAWITCQNEIEGKAPIIYDEVIEEFYAEKNHNASGRCKVLERGHARFALRRSISPFQFGYLPTVPGKENHCAFVIDCPRSMHVSVFKVIVLCEVVPPVLPSSLASVKRVVTVWCGCIAGKGGQCVHGSALLHVVRDLKRANEADESPTSKMCEWNKPNGKSKIDKTTPLAEIMVKRAERLRLTEKRKEVCHREGSGRQIWIPFSLDHYRGLLNSLANEDTVVDVLEVWMEFVDACNAECGGEAAINLWHPDRELHKENKWKMWRDPAPKKLKELEEEIERQEELLRQEEQQEDEDEMEMEE